MKTFLTVLGAVWIIVGFVHLSLADLPASDMAEINQYRFNEKTLAQFFQATKNLVPIVQKIHRSPDSDSDDSEEQDSLAKLVEQLEGFPGAKKAVNDAGMTTRDYLKFEIALAYAASGQFILKSGGTLPEAYSKENVEFFSAHETEFRQHQKDFEVVKSLTDSDSENEDDDD